MDPPQKEARVSSDMEIVQESKPDTIDNQDISIKQQTPAEKPRSAPLDNDVPDGGLDAWLQVIGAWVILMAGWGLINTFGVYQAYYETDMLTSSSASSISWIGSLQACLILLMGLVAGPLFDAGYLRTILAIGLFLISFGMFMTSLCWAYWQVVLAQGLCVGMGMGLTFLPAATLLSQYFRKRRAFAIGLSATGSPVGGIIFPIIFSHLQPTIGFGWATRVIAFIILGLSVVPVVFMRTRAPPPGRMRSLVDNSAWKDFPFMIFTASLMLAFLVLYTPYFYIQLFDELNQLSAPDFAPYTVTLLNVGSVFGRLLPGYYSDKVGTVNVAIFCAFGSAFLAFGWMGLHNLAGVIVFTILYGATSGGIVAISAAALMTFSPDLSRLGTRMGMAFGFCGVSVLVGTPIAGAILGDFTRTRWLATMGYSAGGMVLSGSLMVLSRYALGKKREGWKL